MPFDTQNHGLLKVSVCMQTIPGSYLGNSCKNIQPSYKIDPPGLPMTLAQIVPESFYYYYCKPLYSFQTKKKKCQQTKTEKCCLHTYLAEQTFAVITALN